MSANLALVVQTAKRHAHILALHGCGDALSERSLAYSRRAVETDDRRLEVAAQLQHSHVFEDALLYLFHAVVVVVENALCSFQVEIVLGIFAPRQSDHCLQIVELYAILRTLRVEHIELVEFLTENLCNILRPVLLSRFLLKFLAFWRTFASAKFLLDVLNLLLQKVFALLFVEILASLCADILLQFEQLNLLV